MRLPNGAGSVHKLSGKRHRPWLARGPAALNSEGKIVRPSLGTYRTKKDAVEALTLYKDMADPINYNLLEMFELYKKDRVETAAISEVTLASYDDNFKHLRPLFNKKFVEIKLSDLQPVFNNMKKLNSKNDAPLSRESKKRVKSVLSNVYTFAVKNEYVEKNYTDHLELGKIEIKNEKSIFNEIQIAKMFRNVDKILDLDIILIFIYTGLRPSELLNITKDNVDLDRGVLYDFGIKSNAGKKRIMPISDKIFKFIIDRYNSTDDYLFKTGSGAQMKANYYRRYRFDPAIKELGFTDLNITPYSTRHTFASLMEKNQIQGAVLKDLMGHEKYSTSVDNYIHTDLDSLKAAVNKL